MILVKRGKEPLNLKPVRTKQLAKLRTLAAAGNIPSKAITGYNIVAETLWKAQHEKCCYCEKIIECTHDDVEHYRPKTSANRAPGSSAAHGYWWLAFTWSNLLFSCRICNRIHKNILFPLDHGSLALTPEQCADGEEKPLLLDPASSKVNPVEHIVHVLRGTRWEPEPRNGSQLGLRTIAVCGLWRDQLHDLRKKHVKNIVKPRADDLLLSLKSDNRPQIEHHFERARALFNPDQAHAALSYDALCHFIPAATLLAAIGQTWPKPEQVGK